MYVVLGEVLISHHLSTASTHWILLVVVTAALHQSEGGGEESGLYTYYTELPNTECTYQVLYAYVT